MGIFFWSIFKFTKKFKITALLLLVGLMLFCWFSISRIHLEEDISKVLMDTKETASVNKLMKDIDFSNKVVFIVSQRDTSIAPKFDKMIDTASKFVKSISKADSLIADISLGMDDSQITKAYDIFYRNLPFFLEKEDYQIIEKRLNIESISNTIEGNFKILMTPAGIAMRTYIINDPLHFTPIILQKLKRLQIGDSYKIVQNKIFSSNGYHLFFFMEPAYASTNTGANALLVDNIIRAKNDVDNEICQLDYYGAPVVAAGNAIQIKKDILLTVSLALVLLILLISFLFRSWRVFILVFLPVIFGFSLSVACFYWIWGFISAIALGVGSILMGITLDYTLHAYANYRSTGSIKAFLISLSQPLVISSVTTAVAFLCLYFVESPALKELGLFAAISILGAALFVLLVTPHFLQGDKASKQDTNLSFLDKFVNIEFDKLPYVKLIILLISIISIFTSQKIIFNTNLETLNFQNEYLKKTEAKLKEISSEAFRSVFFVVEGDNIDQAAMKLESYSAQLDSLKNIGIIKKISSAGIILKSKNEQRIRLQRWNNFWTQQKKQNVISNIKTIGLKNHFKPEAFFAFENILNKKYENISDDDQNYFVDVFLKSLVKRKEDKIFLINTLSVDYDDKEILYQEIKTDENVILWDQQYFALQLVDILKKDFNKLAWISLSAVFFILLFAYGRLELAIIAMIPLLVSWLWTLGFMGLCGIEFNIFNIIISTFIFGLGVDYAVFILNALIANKKYGISELASCKLSILLSALTTFAGIGVLIFAKHPALKSIAAVSIIGIGSMLVVSFTLLPLCYRFLYFNNGKKRIAPVTIYNLLYSLFAFGQFIAGCATLSALIPILIITPVRLKKKKLFMHKLVQLCSKFIVYSILGIRKNFINKENLDFSKPKLLVSNHQSHLDLCLIFMLNPKIIALTNNWVWNNPFYGFIVRFLDFYPVTKGLESSVVHLQKCVDDGYSILIFPEGHRTRDGEISRFQNGAIFLSEKLNLDIQPILIHGANHCMDRNEFFMRNGQVSIKFLNIIPKEEYTYKGIYLKRSKRLKAFFVEEFSQLRTLVETPNYYRSKLIQSYIYKGPILEWYLRVKIQLEHNYNFYNDIVPVNATVCDLGCGYGFLASMLARVSSERKIYAIDYDEEKIKLAKNANIEFSNIEFSHADISNVNLPQADVFILNDILHYMPDDLQVQCIEKCMQKLKPGGQIIIRDADTNLKQRTRVTKITEWFSTKLLLFNKTKYENLFFFSSRKIQIIADENAFKMEKFDNTKLTSNLIYKLTRKINS